MNILYLFLSLLPGLVIVVFIYVRDYKQREPLPTIMRSLLFGGLASVPVFLVAHSPVAQATWQPTQTWHLLLGSLGVALLAEVGKFLVFWLYLRKHPDFDEPFDGIVYAVVISMGFAMVENATIVLINNSMEVALGRMFSAVPAHAIFAVLFGWFVGTSRFKPSKDAKKWIIGGLVAAWMYHSAYHFFLLGSAHNNLNWVVWMLLLVGGIGLSFVLIKNLSAKSKSSPKTISK